jgi:hypothetical protein
MFVKLGITRKKTFAYSEKSEEKRVYVDECGIKEHLKREYGALWGVKVEDTKRGCKFHSINVVVSESRDTATIYDLLQTAIYKYFILPIWFNTPRLAGANRRLSCGTLRRGTVHDEPCC